MSTQKPVAGICSVLGRSPHQLASLGGLLCARRARLRSQAAENQDQDLKAGELSKRRAAPLREEEALLGLGRDGDRSPFSVGLARLRLRAAASNG